MNIEWSLKNKQFQKEMNKEATYKIGIQTLLTLREELFQVVEEIVSNHSKEDLCAMPYPNANGYHSKTIAYSLWHIFRIEDIVCNTLIQNKEQILFQGHLERIQSPIITTGNELVKDEIVEFSKQLDMAALLAYCQEVKRTTDVFLNSLDYMILKQKVDERREALIQTRCVSTSADAFWLMDYWCTKDVRGLLKMPFSRHWIMHIEAILRIQKGLK